MEKISNTEAVYIIARALLSCESRTIDQSAIEKATAAAIAAHRDFQSNFQVKLTKWSVSTSDPIYRDIKNKLEEEWSILTSGTVEPMRVDQPSHHQSGQPQQSHAVQHQQSQAMQPQKVQPQYRTETIPRRALDSTPSHSNQLPSPSPAQQDSNPQQANRFCWNCGKQLLDNANFCVGCGNRVNP